MLIAGRAIAGLGASGLTNGVLAMVAASVPMPQRPAIIGLGMGGERDDILETTSS